MKILYLSQKDIDIASEGIYSDLINGLIENGHDITLCCADSKYEKTEYVNDGIKRLKVKVANQFGVNIIKKGLVLLSLEGTITKAIKKHLKNENFDLILYATPPITFANVIKYCKKKYGSKSYLMLKDIFPQNAVDLRMMSTTGLTSILYKLFKAKENKLYIYSDKIGCMSPANIEYILKHNTYLDKSKVELFPNAIKIEDKATLPKTKGEIFDKLNINKDNIVFIYGGNMGKPQGLNFLADAIKNCNDIESVHFIMIGKGAEKDKFFDALKGVKNVTTLDALPKAEYEELCSQCDIGMVVLDKRFTIPNYPSRTLSYLDNSMPVFACTDMNTDIRNLVEDNAKCGKWCYSDDINAFRDNVLWFVNNQDKLIELGKNGRDYLVNNFDVTKNIQKLEAFCNGNAKEY